MPAPLALLVPAVSTLAVLVVGGVASSAPAAAPAALAPPTTRVVVDGEQSGEGYDITRVRLRSGVEGERRAVVRVRLADTHEPGEHALDVWFDLDRDRRPDVMVVAYPDSEYTVATVAGWRETEDDITDEGCFRARNNDDRFTVRFNPHCLGTPASFRVAARGYAYDEEGVVARDWAPARRTLSRRVLSYDPA